MPVFSSYLKVILKSLFVFLLLLFAREASAQSQTEVFSNDTLNQLDNEGSQFSLFKHSSSLQPYRLGKLLYQDDFNSGLENWVIECELSPKAKVEIQNEKLLIDVNCGATVWLKKKTEGNILIQYKRKVIMNDGPNDRLSDLNTFWMATDPANENLFTRDGVFSLYHSLSLYYAGIGGNSNSTTRFRKYMGNGERVLYGDYADKEHLLQANKTYLIEIVVYMGTTKVFVNHELYFTFDDDDPLTEGYFGFRTVKSHQEIDDLKIYRLK